VPVRPDVVVGYARPKAKRKPKARRQQTLADIARKPPSRLSAKPPVPGLHKAKPAKARADTGDILKTATPAARRELAKPKAKRRPSLRDIAEPPKPAKRASLGRNIIRELEGRGLLAEGAKKAAEAVGKHAVIVSTGGGPSLGTSLGTGRGISTRKSGLGSATILAPSAQKAPKLVGRTLKDLINFPAQAVPSVYVPAAAAVEAARGKPARGKKLLHDLPRTDAGAALVTGHPGRALKLAEEHPGFAALEAIGAKGAVGRGAGRVMRATPKGSRVHALASTHREPAVGPSGTTLEQIRSYSPDVTRKAAQVAVERHKARRAAETRKRAMATQDPELLAKANRQDPTRMSDNELRKRVDERVAANETIRRQNRTIAVAQAHEAISPRVATRRAGVTFTRREKPTAATTLRAQAITRASVDDLRAYRDELAAQHEGLRPGEQHANRTLRKELDKAIRKQSDPARLKRAAEDWQKVMEPRQAALVEHGLLAKEQAAKAPLVPYAVRHMEGVKPGEHGPVHADGSPVSAAEIRTHMKARGVTPPSYVTQAPGQRGAKNYFVSSGRPPLITGGTRTGAATVKGTHDVHPDVLVEGVARAQGLSDAADGFMRTVREFAHKPSLGKLPTKREADAKARDLAATTGESWRPVRIQPFAGRGEQLKTLLDKAGAEGALDEHVGASQPVREAMDSAIRGEDGPGPWALMPEAAAAQFAQHLHNLGAGPKMRALQVGQQAFRQTVLATSPTWLTGNVTEAALRTGLARAGPRSFLTGRRVVKRLGQIDPAAARELSARALGGGHFAMADRMHIRRDSSQFAGSAVLEPMARGLGAFWRAKGPKQVATAWKGWTDLVFRQLNGRLESQFQTAMLGKALRDSPLMDFHTLKMGHEAVDQAARGLRNTNEQAAFAREVERMYGKYNAFSPDTRKMITTYTPFIAWTLNAVRFVTDVLPRDHPTATAVVAAAEQATEEWRKDQGLDLFIKGALPGFLQGSLPLSGGRHQRFPFRYTPFGAFGDPLGTVGNAVLPQFSGVLAAFKGEDWKGAKLRKPNGEPADQIDLAKAAAAAFVDATVPIVGQAKRVSKKGISALNPIEPVEPAKTKVRASSAGSTQGDIDALLNGDQTQRDIDALLDNRDLAP
jgi:hypothetical protein